MQGAKISRFEDYRKPFRNPVAFDGGIRVEPLKWVVKGIFRENDGRSTGKVSGFWMGRVEMTG
jgi:hypothetical protein